MSDPRQHRSPHPTAATPDEQVPDGWVYFARSVVTGNIKIGCSVRPRARLYYPTYIYHDAMEGIGVIRGYAQLEAALHRQFAHLALGHEFFRPAPELLAYIDEHAQPWSATYKTAKGHAVFGSTYRALTHR